MNVNPFSTHSDGSMVELHSTQLESNKPLYGFSALVSASAAQKISLDRIANAVVDLQQGNAATSDAMDTLARSIRGLESSINDWLFQPQVISTNARFVNWWLTQIEVAARDTEKVSAGSYNEQILNRKNANPHKKCIKILKNYDDLRMEFERLLNTIDDELKDTELQQYLDRIASRIVALKLRVSRLVTDSSGPAT